MRSREVNSKEIMIPVAKSPNLSSYEEIKSNLSASISTPLYNSDSIALGSRKARIYSPDGNKISSSETPTSTLNSLSSSLSSLSDPDSTSPNLTSTSPNFTSTSPSISANPVFSPLPAKNIFDTDSSQTLENKINELADAENIQVDAKLKEILDLSVKARKEFAFSQEKFHYFANAILCAANKLIENHSNSPSLQNFKNGISEFLKKDNDTKHNAVPEKFIQACKKMKKDLFEQAKADEISKTEINEAFFVHAPNTVEGSWNPIEYSCNLLANTSTHRVFQKLTPIFVKDKNEEFRGRTSNEESGEHLRNCWTQEVSIEETSAENTMTKPALVFTRSACTNGKDKATKELLAAIVTTDPSFDTTTEYSAENPFTLKLSSIQLLSPNSFAGDKDLHSKQINGIKAQAEKESTELEVNGKKIFVKIEKPLLFNFGSNWQHFSVLLSPIFSKCKEENTPPMEALLGTDIANKRNNKNKNLQKIYKEIKGSNTAINGMNLTSAAIGFFGNDCIVGKYLSDEKNSPQDKKIVFCLAAQIANIWHEDLYFKESSNPYAIQEILMILSHKLGYNVSINCKSGKDRTGMLASCVSALAFLLGKGYIGEPFGITLEQRINISQSMFPSLLVTTYNTLFTGFKSSNLLQGTLGDSALASGLARY
ncbi:MAG: hypothetical protein LBI81_01060 [Puniceicoccales bacterium]|jgi:hypothetical protein|nr:hypothetical protein [Puniceicoccales bacterium]